MLLLVSCGGTQYWDKAGATNSEFEKANYSCMKNSQQQFSSSTLYNGGGLVSGNSITTGSSSSGSILNERLYQACMRADGWTIVSDQAVKAQEASKKANEEAIKAKEEVIALEAKNAPLPYSTPASKFPKCTGENDDKNVWNNCIGTMKYPNGNSYTGEFRGGLRDGKGTMRIVAKGRSTANLIQSAEPSTYAGDFRNGKLNGHGVWITDTGKRFEGEFKDNLLVGN